MSKKSSLVTNSAAKIAYMQAVYGHDLNWSTIIGERISTILSSLAASVESSLTAVMANLFASISAVIGPKTEIFVKENSSIQPNVYLILVGSSGSGKSQAFKYFFEKPLRALEGEKQIRLLLEEFTPAGFLKFLSDNGGHAAFASDEFCQHVKAKISSRNDETLAFRSQLNKFYNGRSVSKAVSTKGMLKTDDVYLTVLGVAQPHPYAAFHGEMMATVDGLLSRFMVACNPPVPTVEADDANDYAAPDAHDGRNCKNSSEWLLPYFRRLYELHHGPDKVQYTFTEEAIAMLQSIRDGNMEEKRHPYNQAADKVRQQALQLCDLPDDDTDAKDFDYIVKFSALIHSVESIHFIVVFAFE